MTSLAQDPVEDEFRGNVAVDTANDDGGDQDKDKSALAGPRLREGADGRGGRVLAHVVVTHGGGHAEQDHLHGRECCEGFGEVGRVLHLGDEGGVEDLADEQEGDAGMSVAARRGVGF